MSYLPYSERQKILFDVSVVCLISSQNSLKLLRIASVTVLLYVISAFLYFDLSAGCFNRFSDCSTRIRRLMTWLL